jgi:ABC-2 type transport system ATP-binding protein
MEPQACVGQRGASVLHVEPRRESISVSHLRKDFGAVRAVDDLTFGVEPGSITGFLGPNGAGKTTTLRCILGLVTPTSGTTAIGRVRYADLRSPLQTVGAALEASSFHPSRTARAHLLVLCAAAGLPDRRADEVLRMTGLDDVADRRVGGFSTGMRQRLGLATALLGDPGVLVLDEPATGLDPAGITWLRQLLRYLAHEEGKTVLVSSHLLAEVEHTADRIVIIAGGRLIREGTLEEIVGGATSTVVVRTPQPTALAEALSRAGLRSVGEDGVVVVEGSDAAAVGHLAFVNGIEVHELTARGTDLEQVFLTLTNAVEEAA